jgi:hypothetical protein
MKMFRVNNLRKFMKIIILSLVLSCSLHIYSCGNTDDVDDQSPSLIVHIVIDPASGPITTSETNKFYLMYYNDSTWTSPWLQHGWAGDTLINPSVNSFKTYLAAFWDANGNGILDTGDPCTGYENADPSVPDEMTVLEFIPLEWKEINITLTTARTYP